MQCYVKRGQGAEGDRLEADEGLRRRAGRSRSRHRQETDRHRLPRPRLVDPDYFFVPPQPIKFPVKFTMFVESEGRKGIRKHASRGRRVVRCAR